MNTDLMAWREKAPRDNQEETLQKAIVQHLRLRGTGALWWHVPNGEQRSKRTGARLKAMGVVPGVPDLCFVLPDGRAAFMELKKPGGKMSPEQRAFAAKAVASGADHACVGDIDTALDILEAWRVIRPEAEF